ncbi:MAG: hypothetical protein HY553_00470 [Elusimicrobia bacterium]|nr:hypothetical protein [Elusimicrobiota bacterium]
MDRRLLTLAVAIFCAAPAWTQQALPDIDFDAKAALSSARQAPAPEAPAANDAAAKPSDPCAGIFSRLNCSGELTISVFPAEAENKVLPSKAWLDLVFTAHDRFKVKFSFDPRSFLIAGPARQALREDSDLRQAIEMGIKLKLAAAKGIPNPALIRVPTEALDAAVEAYVADKIDREAIWIASIQGLSLEVNVIKGDAVKLDAEVGKLAPTYYDRADYFHFRIPENGVRVTTSFNDKVQVYFETYKSRFPNLDERVIEDYIKTLVTGQNVSNFADPKANAVEAGLAYRDTLVAFGKRNQDSFYGVFQQQAGLGAGFTGRATLTLEKGSPTAATDGSLIKRLNAVLERQFGKVDVFGQFFARRSPELSQPNVTATLGGATVPVLKHMDLGGNVGRINGGALYEFTGRLHF